MMSLFGKGNGEEVKPNAGDLVVCGQFTMQAQLPNGRALTLNGYTYYGEDEDSLNARLDVFQAVLERHRARCEVPELEAKLEMVAKAIEDTKAAVAEIERRERQHGNTPSSQEKLSARNMKTNIPRLVDEYEKGRLAIITAKIRGGLAARPEGAEQPAA